MLNLPTIWLKSKTPHQIIIITAFEGKKKHHIISFITMMIDDTYGILYVNCNYNFLDIIKNSSLNNHSSIQRKKHHISSMIIMMIDDAACDIFYVDCTYNFLDIINNSSSDNHSSI